MTGVKLRQCARYIHTNHPRILHFTSPLPQRQTLARGWGRFDLQWGTRKCVTVGEPANGSPYEVN